MEKCEYQDCNNEAKYYDETDSKVCGPCMDREIEDGSDPKWFETIKSVQEALSESTRCIGLSACGGPCDDSCPAYRTANQPKTEGQKLVEFCDRMMVATGVPSNMTGRRRG